MKKTITILNIILILCMFIISTNTYATTIDPNSYRPSALTESDTAEVVDKFGIVVSALRTVGIVVFVITIIILGIKYMVASVEERADYKKTMIPYLIGATLFFALTTILSVIVGVADNLNT